MKKIFTFCVSLLAALSVFAYDFQSGDLFYNITSSSAPYTVEVTYEEYYSSDNYSGLTTATIPASVSYNGITYSVTSIGERAFFVCSSLTSVTLPNSVTSIGDRAFSSCTSLTSVTLPNSVTSIGDRAFSSCTSLTSVTLPNSVTSIGDEAFWYCSSLTSITIPNSVTSIGELAFNGCSSLTSITIPNSVTSIGDGVFNNCSSLTSVVWNVKSCAEFAKPSYAPFDDICTQITSFTFGDDVEYVPAYLCCGMSNLSSITIPNSVKSIGNRAFAACSSLTSITIPNTVTSIEEYAFLNCSSLTSLTIPNSVTSIGKSALENCSSLTSITIGNNLPSIGDDVFKNCSSLTSVVWNVKNCAEFASYYDGPFYNICTQITSFTIGDDVEYIPAYLCSSMINLSSVTISNSVTRIGVGAFFSCSSLTSITIPNSVTSIGEEAFFYCSSLTSITIPNSVTSIENRAFYKCNNLTSVTISNNVESIGNRTFYDCTSLASITIPNSVTSIGEEAFYDCTSLTSVTIPNSVTSIGEQAFYNCSSLDTIYVEATIPPTLSLSGYLLFYGTPSSLCYIPCGTLAVYEASDWANYMGEFVEECVGGQQIFYTSTDGNIVTPNATDVFGANIVSNEYKDGQGVITFDGPVTSIGDSAFTYCSSLTSITIPNSVVSIGDVAFYGCSSLTSITIPNSVTNIEMNAFAYCSSLTSVTIPNSVTSIGINALGDCDSLTSIVVEDGNATYDSRNNCNAIIETATNTLVAGCKNTIISNSVTAIGGYAFSGCRSLTSVTIPNSVTNIGYYAFRGCSSLTSITIPNSVMNIGYYAFNGCSSLTSITIPNSVMSIEYGAFAACSSLTSVTIPNSVTSIGVDVLGGCVSLTSIVVEDDNATYDSRNNCNAIIETATNTLVAGCKNTIIPNSVTSIGYCAFNGCFSLTSVTIPNNVTSIGEVAFYRCSSLDTIYVEAITPPALGEDAFNSTPVCYIPCGTLSAYEASDWAQYVSEFVEEGCIDSTWQIKYTSTDGNIVTPYKTDVFGANIVSNTYENGVGTITFDGPVTSIGYQAFRWCNSLTSITIPNSVTSIGYETFDGCSFTSITIPEYVNSIGAGAFSDCRSLASITIPNSVTSIGALAFMNCYSLSSITIPNGVSSIERYVFANCESLSFVIIPNSVTTIGDYAFEACTSLISVTIPQTVTNVGKCAFRNCKSITSITIPNSVTKIGTLAFGACDSLKSMIVESGNAIYDSRENCNAIIETKTNTLIAGCQNTIIPNSVENIGPSAFWTCISLASITIPNGVMCIGEHAFRYCFSLASITLPETVTSIGESAFEGCRSLTSITIPNSLTSIGQGAFKNCSVLDTIHLEATTPPALEDSTVFMNTPSPICVIPCGTLAVYEASDWANYMGEFVEDCVEGQQIYYTSTDGNIVTPNDVNVFGANIVSNTYENGVGTITFDGPVARIGEEAFYHCTSLASITIPNSVISIGVAAFSNCGSLNFMVIPEGVTTIGSNAFQQCFSLQSIYIPRSVTSIGDAIFIIASMLGTIVVDDSNMVYDSRSNCNAIIETATNTLIAGCQNTVIPNSVATIGNEAFAHCYDLTSITIPNSVTSIGDRAFYVCSSLTSITIPNSVTSIGDYAFSSCSGLTSIVVEGGNATYDSRENCNAIIETATNTLIAGCKNTIIPNSVTSIGADAFYSCKGLTSITIPNSVTSIGEYAFSGCSSLTSITIPNSVTSIGDDAFWGCSSLTSITIPNSVTSIGDWAFCNCSSLTSITIPNSIMSIARAAFYGCSSLDTIHVEATTPPALEDSTVFRNTPSPVCVIPCGTLAAYEASDWAQYVSEFVEEGCIDPTWQITYTSNNDSIVTPYATDVFGANIVSNTYENGVGTITFDAPLTRIGTQAFHDCFTLTSIIVPNSVKIIGNAAFSGTYLESVVIGSGVTSIGEDVFGGCGLLTSIVVDTNNTTFDSREDCNAIIKTSNNILVAGCKTTIIPNTIKGIGNYAFAGSWEMTSIEIPDGVETIGSSAFGGCTVLRSVMLPNTLTTIGNDAFSTCPALTSITIPSSVKKIDDDAFWCDYALDTIYVEATTPPTLGYKPFYNAPVSHCFIPCGTLSAYEASDWANYVSEFIEEGCPTVQMCGDDLYWEYADGVLTITGTGDMYDYATDTDVPWYDVRGNIKTVSLPDAMTKIGQNAFYKCTNMTTINMPTSLTAIGEKAFAQDTKLACDIILPASMTNIATRAFFNCKAVPAFHVEATTPPTVQADAFDYTTAPIHVPCGYGHIYGKHTQWGMLNLEMCELLQDNVYYYPIDGHTARAVTYHSNPTDTIVIPSAVVIGDMPRTVTEVADFAFTDCDNLPAIYFNEGLEYIGERAFVRCYGLKGTITLPTTLTTIGERAFSYCDNVEKYLLQAMTPPTLGADVFTGNNKNALFYISCEAMDDYKVATNWSSLKSRLRDACLNIYHYNTDLGANGVHTTKDTLVASIYYRRKFTPDRWETLYLPFEVDRVTVLEDGVEYDLTAWDIVNGGHYFLAKPDGMLNKEILFGFTDELESHTPYIIQFPDTYYDDKIITFYGKESWNKLSTSFEVLSSSAWMQIAGNTTLQDQLLEKPVYMLRSGLDFILQKTTTTLHPFECYVMPYTVQSGAPARMSVRLRDDVATAVESMKGNESRLAYTINGNTLTVYPQGQAFSIYSLNGALIYSCEAGKETVDCELNSGCYLLHAGTEAHKIML